MLISKQKKISIRSAIPRKLKWGLAGCGNFAENSFLPAFQMVKRSKLVSVFSHDFKRAQNVANHFGVPNAFNDFDEFLKSDFEALYISSANADHHWQVIKAAKAGKNILCERPIALNSEQISEMIDVCKQNKVIWIINHFHRFHPLVRKAKELVEKQMIGKIVSISATYNINYVPNDNFRFKKQLSGGGALRDLGSQMIDLLRYFGGEISEVKAFMDNVVYRSEVEDFSAALVKFNNGGYGYFNVSYNTKKAFNRIEILGHNGTLCIENFLAQKNVATKLIIDLHGEAKKVFRKRANKLSFMIRSVQRSFMKKQPVLVSGEDGLINMQIIEEIEKQCLYGKS